MNEIFVDTLYFAARLNPRDQWHGAALEVEAIFLPTRMITTESVLIETLNFFAGFPAEMKSAAANAVNSLFTEQGIEIIPHTQDVFFDGLRLYKSRLDKRLQFDRLRFDEPDADARYYRNFDARPTFRQEGFTILL